MIISQPVKDPSEALRVRIDCAYWLGSATLVSASAAVSPDTPESPLVASLAIAAEGTELNVYLAGGVAGTVYTVSLAMASSTAIPRSDTLLVRCKELDG